MLGFLLLAEGACRLLPVSTATMIGYHVDADVMTYPPGHAFTISTGWDLRNAQKVRANNWGFASHTDFAHDPSALALIGNSYVEASMLDPSDRPARRLQTELGDVRPVYGFGSPGTALMDFSQRVRLSREKFGTREMVIWADAGTARQSRCGQANVHSRCLDPSTFDLRTVRQPPAGSLKQAARHSALLQYVFAQLKVDADKLARATIGQSSTSAPSRPTALSPAAVDDAAKARALAVIDAAVSRFFHEIEPWSDTLRILFIVDGRRSATAPVGDLRDLERQYFIRQLQAHGAEVIDLEPVYRQHMQVSRLSLEVGPYDTHLNALGVQLVMKQVAERVRRWRTG